MRKNQLRFIYNFLACALYFVIFFILEGACFGKSFVVQQGKTFQDLWIYILPILLLPFHIVMMLYKSERLISRVSIYIVTLLDAVYAFPLFLITIHYFFDIERFVENFPFIYTQLMILGSRCFVLIAWRKKNR